MTPEDHETDLDRQISERFDELPKVVQEAITSADIQKRLRSLADTHKLHIDQWQKLEDEVMLSLLGFQNPTDLAKNIQSEVGLDVETATALATDINHIVFEPVRIELEHQLATPTVQSSAATTAQAPQQANRPVVAPGTPPTPTPTEKSVRADIAPTYSPSTPSHERKTIEGDPYREQIG